MRVAVLLLGLGAALSAQTRVVDDNLHGWYNYFGDHPISAKSRWGVHLEGQWRRHDAIAKWQQLLLRPGVNFAVRPWLTLTGGYCFVESWPYGDFPSRYKFPEHRLWEQAQFRYRTGKSVAWTTRLRFENRWIGVKDAAGRLDRFRYENRFRGMQRITVPVQGKTYFTAYDELWFFVKPYASNSLYDQNRAYAALGYRMSPRWQVEAGYMNQALLQRSGRVLESNHTLMVSLISTAPF